MPNRPSSPRHPAIALDVAARIARSSPKSSADRLRAVTHRSTLRERSVTEASRQCQFVSQTSIVTEALRAQ
jgi:hypothetical protein